MKHVDSIYFFEKNCSHKFHMWMAYFLYELMQHAFSSCSFESICSHKCHISVVSSLHELMKCAYLKSLFVWNENYKFHIWKISLARFPLFNKILIQVIDCLQWYQSDNWYPNCYYIQFYEIQNYVCHATYHQVTNYGQNYQILFKNHETSFFVLRDKSFRMLELDLFRL